MSTERLRIFLRRRQLTNDTGNVVVQCNPDGTATYVPGVVDNTWLEVTEFTRGLEKLNLTWDQANQASTTPAGEANPGGSNYDKGISATLIFNDEAFQFIDDYLLSDPCGILNAIEVRIDDALCQRTYRTFELKADNITEEPFGAPCEVEARLREMDAAWHCVHKTFIWDNWQNWFANGSAKQHPTFLTGIEPRPRLVNSVRAGLTIFWQTCPAIPPIPLPGGNNSMRRILQVDNFVDAPLVRDIISNVCDKCGLGIDTIFHDAGSPYYNLCFYYPSAGAMHHNDGASVTSPALWYHFDNRWNVTLAEFLDKLKLAFNAEWYVTPGSTLVFRLKDTTPVAPVLDLPVDADIWDRDTLRYTFNGDKKPAFGRYEYTIDAADLASQESRPLYNDIVDYDGPANNLMLEGQRTKQLEWSSTGFIRDGRARSDYTRDLVNDGETVAYGLIVLLAVILAALLAGILSAGAGAALGVSMLIWVANIAGRANDLRDLFGSDTYTGAVRITAEEIAQPRLLLWDGESMNRAKVVREDPDLLIPNLDFNPTSIPYTTRNAPLYNPVGGLYVFNYPMYFESYYEGNLYDRFHDGEDNPLHSLQTHRSFDVKLHLCCEVLDALGAWDGDFARIGHWIRLQERSGYDRYGRIGHFEVLYEEERVTVRGQVFNVKT